MTDMVTEEAQVHSIRAPEDGTEQRSRTEAARALRQALIYLECEALDADLPFTAYMISLAAMSAGEVEAAADPEN